MKRYNEPGEFEYNNEEVAKIIFQNISDELAAKLVFGDMMNILELRDEYFKKVGIIEEEGKESICSYPIDLDEESMNLFIITNAIQLDIILTEEEIEEIMMAELIYLEINNQIDEPTHLN